MKNSMLTTPNEFKLGIFSPNCSSGLAVTTVPERWDNSWDNNLNMARMFDEHTPLPAAKSILTEHAEAIEQCPDTKGFDA